jgi:hypothetical protein
MSTSSIRIFSAALASTAETSSAFTQVARTTFEACLWVLRTYGVARLNDDWMRPRLAQFSPEQLQELVAAMRRLKAKGWPKANDELIGLLEGLCDDEAE